MPVLAWFSLIPLGLAVAILYRTWAERISRGTGLGTASVLALLAMIIAAQPMGAGRGVSWILVAVSIAAASALWFARTRKPRKAHRDRVVGPAKDWPDWPLRWLMAGPLAGLASVAMGAATAALLPFAPGTNVMAALFIILIVWAVAAGWVAATARRMRTAGILAGTLILGAGGSAAGFLL